MDFSVSDIFSKSAQSNRTSNSDFKANLNSLEKPFGNLTDSIVVNHDGKKVLITETRPVDGSSGFVPGYIISYDLIFKLQGKPFTNLLPLKISLISKKCYFTPISNSIITYKLREYNYTYAKI